jgi:hypothetical protein
MLRNTTSFLNQETTRSSVGVRAIGVHGKVLARRDCDVIRLSALDRLYRGK